MEETALPSDLAHDMVDTLVDRQATDVVLLDLTHLSAFADEFVIASVDNIRQASAVVDAIDERVRERGGKRVRPEGDPASGWVLLDVGGGVIVHVFSVEGRARYDLEGLWNRAQEVVRVQ
jgi:ribosome-associated protein